MSAVASERLSWAGNEVTRAQLGAAGAHLVCSRLLLAGYHAFIVAEGLPYDVACEVGQRLIRIQVKTTKEPKQPSRGRAFYYWKAMATRNSYGEGAIDLFACVALDRDSVAWLLPSDASATSITLRTHDDAGSQANGGFGQSRCGPRGRVFADYGLERALELVNQPPTTLEPA